MLFSRNLTKKGCGDVAGIDPSFGMNNFNQAKYKNESTTIAHAFLNLLFGKPGYFPSMPNLGINIEETLYAFWDEIDEAALKATIVAQCSAFKEYVDNGQLDVIKSSYKNQPLLIVVVPVQIKDDYANLTIGITQDAGGSIKYNYVYE